MSQKTPLVSVIMNCHNGAKFLTQAMKSLKAQTYKNWELIFFDNNSSDESFKVVKKLKNKKIKYFFSKKYLNLYHARNLAIKKARGKYITFLDTDDLWHHSKLKKQVNFLEKKEKYALVYSNYYVINMKKKITFKKFNKFLPYGDISHKLIKNYTIGVITVMIKTEIFKKYKFNNKYQIIGDFDLFFRLSQNFKIGCVQNCLAYYRLHESNFSKKLKTYIIEMSYWISSNNKKLNKLGYNLSNQKFYIFKLKIKNFLNNFLSLGV